MSRQPFLVAGVDPSLTGSAIAVGTADGTVTRLVELSSKARGKLVLQRFDRYVELAVEVIRVIGEARVVLIEGYSYNSQGSVIASAEFGAVLRRLLIKRGNVKAIAEVAPGTIKKFTTGKGNSKKAAMVAAVVRQYDADGALDIDTDNKADAVALFKLGCAALDPGLELAKAKRKAADDVAENIRKSTR